VAALNWYRKAGIGTSISLAGDETEVSTLRRQLEEAKRQLDEAKKELQNLKGPSATDADGKKHPQSGAATITELDATVKQLQN
jgi:outer membrane protein TolC